MKPPEYHSRKPAAYFERDRFEVLEHIPRSCKRLLDVGCGAGKFGALAKQKLGCEVWGVEPITAAAREAGLCLDHIINAPFLESLDLPEQHFDAVTFNDSLEHFPYPEPPLRYSHRLLTPNGVMVCSVPNVRYLKNVKHLLIDADWRYEERGILDYTHLRFFTKKSLLRVIAANGYEVVHVKGINSHRWAGRTTRFLHKIFADRFEDTQWQQFIVIARKAKSSCAMR